MNDDVGPAFEDYVPHPVHEQIILDALDECKRRKGLLAFIQEMSGSNPQELCDFATRRREV